MTSTWLPVVAPPRVVQMAGRMYSRDCHTAALIAIVAGRFGQGTPPHVGADEEGRRKFVGDRNLVHALAVNRAEVTYQAIDHIAMLAFQRKSLANRSNASADIADLEIGGTLVTRITENHRLPCARQKSQMVERDGGAVFGHHRFDRLFARRTALCEQCGCRRRQAPAEKTAAVHTCQPNSVHRSLRALRGHRGDKCRDQRRQLPA